MKQIMMAELEQMINHDYGNTAGFVIQQEGRTLYEKYFNGCTAGSCVHICSVTKSIISLLFGIAIDKGYIKTLDQRVLDFFPDYKVTEDNKTVEYITIRHLLTMTAPYRYETEPYMEYFTSGNWVQYALDSLGGSGRIGEFRYAALVGPDILSAILAKATGRNVLDFATKNVFAPLGIRVESNAVFQNEEEQMAWYEDTTKSTWAADQAGVNTAGWGLKITTMDMAKIGQLYAQEGVWGDRRIVSAEWIKASTKEHSRWNQLRYGYLWWLIDENDSSYAAIGDGGNILYVNPRKKLVIASTALPLPEAKDRLELITGYIEPMLEQ